MYVCSYIHTYITVYCIYIGPVHIMITPNVSFIDNDLVITVSWQVRNNDNVL